MADYYVDSVSGNDTNLGTSWIEAFATLLKATATATANQEIFVSHVHNETPNVNVEYVLADNLIITSVNKTDDSYAFGALIDNSSDWYSITFNQSSTVSNVYKISGIHFKSGAYTQLKLSLSVIIFDRCEISQPSNSSTLINFNTTISLSVIFNLVKVSFRHLDSCSLSSSGISWNFASCLRGSIQVSKGKREAKGSKTTKCSFS